MQRARPAQQSSGSAEWTEVCSEGDATNPVVFLPPLSSPILYIINPRFNYIRGYSSPYNLSQFPHSARGPCHSMEARQIGKVRFDSGSPNPSEPNRSNRSMTDAPGFFNSEKRIPILFSKLFHSSFPDQVPFDFWCSVHNAGSGCICQIPAR